MRRTKVGVGAARNQNNFRTERGGLIDSAVVARRSN